MDLTNIRNWLIPSKREAAATAVVPSGIYHYIHESDGAYTRFHLRVEPDGQGILMANASAAIRLSPSGVTIAKALLDKQPAKDIVDILKTQYKGADTATMQADVNRIQTIIQRLSKPEDDYPILNMNEANPSVFESQLFAPLEATITLADPALTIPLLNQLWQIGIPSVTVALPENPNTAHLVQTVERAEDLGMITGVRGRATDLAQPGLITGLAQAGVDYVTVLIVSGDTAVHDEHCGAGDWDTAVTLIQTLQDHSIYPVAEIALINTGISSLGSTLLTLINKGVSTFSFFTIVRNDDAEEDAATPGDADTSSDATIPATAMPQTADWVEETADIANARFIWQPPVQRNPALTLSAQIRQGPRTAGDVAVRIEPNGDVIAPRGPHRVAGNIFSQPWADIWQDAIFTRYRERVTAPTRCVNCPGLVICQADCPREPEGWAGL